MRRTSVLAFLLTFVAVSQANAQKSGNVFIGYSYYNTDLSNISRTGLNGWQATLEGKILPGLGIVADFGGHYGSLDYEPVGVACPTSGCRPVNANPHIYDVLFGPRFSASFGRFRPFAEFEFGVSHLSASPIAFAASTSFANATGGGLDYRIVRHIAWRIQADDAWTHFTNRSLMNRYQDDLRVATGIVFRF